MPSGHARELLLEAAESLILERGLASARVDEICRAAGVTKGAFYHHFESKDALALAVLDVYFARITEAFATHVPDAAPQERLRLMLRHAEQVAGGPLLRRGCLMAVYALEFGETDDRLQAALADRFQRLGAGVEGELRAALRDHGSSKAESKREAEFLARQFVACMEGGIVLAKAHRDPERIVEAVRFFRESVEARLL